MGIAAGIVALVAAIGLLVGVVVNHMRVVSMRERREELDHRMVGLEARLAQLVEQERRQLAAARQRAVVQPVPAPLAQATVRRVPPPLIQRPPAPPSAPLA